MASSREGSDVVQFVDLEEEEEAINLEMKTAPMINDGRLCGGKNEVSL